MKAYHDMAFGARLAGSGAEFSIWAPTAVGVDLVLESTPAAESAVDTGPTRHLPMQATGDGWFHLALPECRAGQRYRYRINAPVLDGDGVCVPDPASRFQPLGVEGPSEVIAPERFDWDDDWHGRPWHSAVIYELHVGSFTPEGTYRAAEAKLAHLVETGITAIELMPLAQFAGARGWGYDGVLPFAPQASYGRPDELKHFVQAAHRLGLMVMLDVVYNHFGPEGNWLYLYAAPFFNPSHGTPWGAAIGFDGAAAATVRSFYIDNALYWLHEFGFDGLRLDAVHAIRDDSAWHILDELAHRVRAALGSRRHVHLVIENSENEARWLARAEDAASHPAEPAAEHGPDGPVPGAGFDAQWNDDFHHAAHIALTAESGGYYSDFTDAPVAQLARSLAEGFIYQGQPSAHLGGEPRGEPSRHLAPTAFINFLQNHDQIGNRPYGERLTALAGRQPLEAMTVLWLLAPQIPLLFMGEEFGARTPFRYFCDFHGELRDAVSKGRRRELAGMLGLTDPDAADPPIPDPSTEASFSESKLDWAEAAQLEGRTWLQLYRSLLKLRQRVLVPRLPLLVPGAARHAVFGERALQVAWPTRDGKTWLVQANLGADRVAMPTVQDSGAELVYGHGELADAALGAWSVRWLLALDGASVTWAAEG